MRAETQVGPAGTVMPEAGDDPGPVEGVVEPADPIRTVRIGAGGDSRGGRSVAGAGDPQSEPVEALAEVGFQFEKAGGDPFDPDSGEEIDRGLHPEEPARVEDPGLVTPRTGSKAISSRAMKLGETTFQAP